MRDWVTCAYCKSDTLIDDEVIEQIEARDTKRCVSVLVVAARRQRRLARELWHKHRDRYRHKKEAQLLMQAAREIMPKKGN